MERSVLRCCLNAGLGLWLAACAGTDAKRSELAAEADVDRPAQVPQGTRDGGGAPLTPMPNQPGEPAEPDPARTPSSEPGPSSEPIATTEPDAAMLTVPDDAGAPDPDPPSSPAAPADAGMPSPGPRNPGPCSLASKLPGCDDPAVMDCICEQGREKACCEQAWDDICVGLVQGFQCAGDCCRASGSLGCADPAVETTVCAASPECCSEGWDDFCTVVAEANGACEP